MQELSQTTKDHAEPRAFLRTALGPLQPLPKELVHHHVILGCPPGARFLGIPQASESEVLSFWPVVKGIVTQAHI